MSEPDPAQPADGAAPTSTERLLAAPPWLRLLVRTMDEAIPIPGTRFRLGADAVLGLLVPGAGDAASAASHIALLWSAFHARVPRVLLARMVLNAGLDALFGMVPIVGDLFDISFKANRRNLELLERSDRRPGRATVSDYVVLGAAVLAVLLVMSIPLLLAVALYAWLFGS